MGWSHPLILFQYWWILETLKTHLPKVPCSICCLLFCPWCSLPAIHAQRHQKPLPQHGASVVWSRQIPYQCIRNLGDTTKRPDTFADGAWPSQAVPFPEPRCGTRVEPGSASEARNFLQLLPKFHHLRDWEHLGCSNLDHFHVRENPTGNMAGKIHLERIVRKRMISWELFVGLMDKVDCSSINEMPFKNLQGNKGYLHRNRGIESFSTAVEDIQKASSTWFSSTKLHLRLRWFLGNLPSSDSWRDFRYSNSSVNPSPIAFWGIWKKVGFAANGAARGKEVLPMSMESTRLAQSRPSAMAVTTKEAPRRQSPQAYKLLQGASSACKR